MKNLLGVVWPKTIGPKKLGFCLKVHGLAVGLGGKKT
jgi:hypothetical protein